MSPAHRGPKRVEDTLPDLCECFLHRYDKDMEAREDSFPIHRGVFLLPVPAQSGWQEAVVDPEIVEAVLSLFNLSHEKTREASRKQIGLDLLQ